MSTKTLKLINSTIEQATVSNGTVLVKSPELTQAIKVFLQNYPQVDGEKWLKHEGNEVTLTTNGYEWSLFVNWLADHIQMGLTDYEHLEVIERNHPLGNDFYKAVIDNLPYAMRSQLCILPKRAYRSFMVQYIGEKAISRLEKTREEINKRFPSGTLRILKPKDYVTIIGEDDDITRVYIFCEYMGDYTKPWTKCVIAWLDDKGVIRYREEPRSTIRYHKSTSIKANDLGQSIISSMEL